MDPRVFAYNYFVMRGWSPEQAAGIVGNLAVESFNPRTGQALDPTVTGDNGTAFGIAQWRGERQRNLANFAEANGLDYRSLEGQLGFVDHELRTTEKRAGDRLRSAKTPQEATDIFMRHYERPNPKLAHFDRRLANALEVSGSGPVATGTAMASAENVPMPDRNPAALPSPMVAAAEPSPALPERNPLAQALAQAGTTFAQAAKRDGFASGDFFSKPTMADTPILQQQAAGPFSTVPALEPPEPLPNDNPVLGTAPGRWKPKFGNPYTAPEERGLRPSGPYSGPFRRATAPLAGGGVKVRRG